MNSDRIELNAAVLAGKPVLKGTRISVEQILDHLASGWSHQEIVDNYPTLKVEDISACLVYASDLLHEERFFPVKAV